MRRAFIRTSWALATWALPGNAWAGEGDLGSVRTPPRKGTDPLFERKGCPKFKLRFDAIFPMKTRPHLYNIYFGSHFFGAAGGGAPRDLQQTAAQRRLMLTGVSSRRRQNPSKIDPFSMHTHAMESRADTYEQNQCTASHTHTVQSHIERSS